MRSDAAMMAETIMRNHGGQAYFNYDEVSQIIGCGRNTVAAILHESGIIVKRVGPSKRISAYDIAELMSKNRVAAID